jgi:hypothetical protein
MRMRFTWCCTVESVIAVDNYLWTKIQIVNHLLKFFQIFVGRKGRVRNVNMLYVVTGFDLRVDVIRRVCFRISFILLLINSVAAVCLPFIHSADGDWFYAHYLFACLSIVPSITTYQSMYSLLDWMTRVRSSYGCLFIDILTTIFVVRLAFTFSHSTSSRLWN